MSEQSNSLPELSWDLADRLTKALKVRDIGVGEMAEYLGYSRNTVSNYINGHTEPKPAVLRTWALRCGVPFEWLATGEITNNGPDGGSSQGIAGTGCIAEPFTRVVPLRLYPVAA